MQRCPVCLPGVRQPAECVQRRDIRSDHDRRRRRPHPANRLFQSDTRCTRRCDFHRCVAEHILHRHLRCRVRRQGGSPRAGFGWAMWATGSVGGYAGDTSETSFAARIRHLRGLKHSALRAPSDTSLGARHVRSNWARVSHIRTRAVLAGHVDRLKHAERCPLLPPEEGNVRGWRVQIGTVEMAGSSVARPATVGSAGYHHGSQSSVVSCPRFELAGERIPRE